MNTLFYIMTSLAILVIILLEILTLKKKKRKKSSKLATFAMTLVVVGIIFGDNPLIGYFFVGVGVILGVIDIIKNLEKK